MKNALLVLLISLSSFAISQENDRSSKIEELHTRKWESLISQAQLTPKEIEAVHPVFLEYEHSTWKMHQEHREFFRSTFQNAKKNKPNYAELNDRYVEFEFQEAQLFKNYHLKLRKLLQPETLFRYYKAEREFKRKLLHDLQEHKQINR